MGLGGVAKRIAAQLAPRTFIMRGATGPEHRIGLTFDDGPHPENTPRILDVLDAHGVRATFFVQGDMVERHPTLLREVAARGHRVGNHGYGHMDARDTAWTEYLASVLRTQALLEEIVGSPLPRYFRPPYGSITLRSTIALVRHGYQFVFWSLDSRDSFVPDASALLAHVEGQRMEPGCIMLLHEDYHHTVVALEPLIALVRRRGLVPVAIDSLLLRQP